MSDELNPDFPIVDGDYHLTGGWHIVLPQPFNRRIEDGSLVLWTGELTFWFNVWNNERKASVNDCRISRRNNALRGQHGRMGATARDILSPQTLVDGDRRVYLAHDGVGSAAETTAPNVAGVRIAPLIAHISSCRLRVECRRVR